MGSPDGQALPFHPPDPIGATDDLAAVVNELCGPDSEHMVRLFRWAPAISRYAYTREIPANSFSLEWTRSNFGGGKYNARVVDPKGKHVRSVVFAVDDSPAAGAGAPPASLGDHSDLAEIRALVRANTEALNALLRARGAAPDSIETALRIIEAIRGHTPPPADPTAQLKSMLDIFRQGVEIGSTRDPEDGMIAVVDKVFPPLLDLLRESVSNDSAKTLPSRTRLNDGAGTVSRGEPRAIATPGPGVSPSPAPSLLDQMRRSIGQLAKLAEADREPEVYAVVFLDQLSQAHYDELVTLTARADFVPMVFTAFPEIKAHEKWFHDFLSSLKDTLGGTETSGADGSPAQ